MTNLRFIERNGEKVLQQEQLTRCGYTSEHKWVDVPIMQEPKKAREWFVWQFDNSDEWHCGEYTHDLGWTINYRGKRPDASRVIKVREVLEPESGK